MQNENSVTQKRKKKKKWLAAITFVFGVTNGPNKYTFCEP